MRERIKDIALRLGPPVGVGLVLGLIGPFGTFDLLPPGPRLGYWLAVVSLNWALADAGIRRLEALAGDRLPAPRVSVPLLGALAVSVPATGVVALAGGLSGIGWPGSVADLYWKVLLLLAAISLPAYAVADLREEAAAARPASDRQPRCPAGAPPPAPRTDTPDRPEGRRHPGPPASDRPAAAPGLALFLARLPGPLPGRLLCLETQDHYLAVHTTGGTELILCRMEDAARELDGIGRRVHRSWWVAGDAVAAAPRTGQRQTLRLIDGRSVPVGRSFKPGLRAAGWI